MNISGLNSVINNPFSSFTGLSSNNSSPDLSHLIQMSEQQELLLQFEQLLAEADAGSLSSEILLKFIGDLINSSGNTSGNLIDTKV